MMSHLKMSSPINPTCKFQLFVFSWLSNILTLNCRVWTLFSVICCSVVQIVNYLHSIIAKQTQTQNKPPLSSTTLEMENRRLPGITGSKPLSLPQMTSFDGKLYLLVPFLAWKLSILELHFNECTSLSVKSIVQIGFEYLLLVCNTF